MRNGVCGIETNVRECGRVRGEGETINTLLFIIYRKMAYISKPRTRTRLSQPNEMGDQVE